MNEARGKNEWDEVYGAGIGCTVRGAQLCNVPVALLDPWQDADGKGQPFHAYQPEQMREMVDNIREHGIITPLRVRPVGQRFQILSGHNRCAAAKILGMNQVPALVESVDDDEAASILVDSNLQQRQELLPSEKAFAYKLKLEAMKHQGNRSDLTSDQSGPKLTASEKVAAEMSDSQTQVKRYIRLTYLTPSLLQMVDEGKLKLIAGVEVSFLSLDMQAILSRLISEENLKVPTAKAKLLHRVMPKTEQELIALLAPKEKKVQVFKLELPDLSEKDYSRLAANTAFQEEMQTMLQQMVQKYLKE